MVEEVQLTPNSFLDRQAGTAAAKIIQALNLNPNLKIEISPTDEFPRVKTSMGDTWLDRKPEQTLVIPRDFSKTWGLVRPEQFYKEGQAEITEKWAQERIIALFRCYNREAQGNVVLDEIVRTHGSSLDFLRATLV